MLGIDSLDDVGACKQPKCRRQKIVEGAFGRPSAKKVPGVGVCWFMMSVVQDAGGFRTRSDISINSEVCCLGIALRPCEE